MNAGPSCRKNPLATRPPALPGKRTPWPLPRGITWEPGIRKFRVRVSRGDGTGKLEVTRWETYADARDYMTMARGELIKAKFTGQNRVTLQQRQVENRSKTQRDEAAIVTVAQYAEKWLNREAKANGEALKPASRKTYEATVFNHLLPSIGSMALSSLSQKEIDDLRSGLPAGSVRDKAGAVFKAMLHSAMADGTMPPRQLRWLIPAPTMARTLADGEMPTIEHLAQLRSAMPPELAIVVDLVAWCGLQPPGELLGLQRCDFEFLHDPLCAAVHVRRQWTSAVEDAVRDNEVRHCWGSLKNPWRSRTIEILPDAVAPGLAARLQRHLDTYVAAALDAPLFPAISSSGNANCQIPISHNTLRYAWQKACRATGLSWRMYDLRHRAATTFQQIGYTDTDIKAVLGHSPNSKATSIYLHTSARHRRQKLNLLIGT